MTYEMNRIRSTLARAAWGTAAALVLVAATHGNSHAQTSEAPQQSDDGIEVVVTASRGMEQRTLEIPQAVDSITAEEIDKSEYQDLDDILRRLPNVGLAPAEGNPNYWQEGFTIRGLGAQRVLTLSDGIRQAGQGIGYGGGNLSLYDTLEIDRIEVVRGPASVLYGTDAFGGVINVITREPTQRETFGVNGGMRTGYDGSWDRLRTGGFLDFGGESFAAVVGGSYVNSGFPNLPDGDDPNSGSFRQTNVWNKADFFFTPDTKLRIIANNSRNSDVLVLDDTIVLPIATFPPPGAAIPTFSPLYFSFPLYQRSTAGAELSVEDISDSWELFKTGFFWQAIDREFVRQTAFYPTFSPGFAGPPFFVDPSATVDTASVRTDDEVNTYESQTQARFNFGDHTVTIGIDLGYDTSELPEVESLQTVAVAGIGPVFGQPVRVTERVRADAEQYRSGAYVQDLWKTGSFEFTPGVRVDYFSAEDDVTDSDESETGVSGSLGSLYKMTEEESLYMTLATGFRAPDLGERYQNGIVNLGAPTRIIGNPELDPERAYTVEIGGKHESDALSASVAGFFNRIEDYIGTRALGLIEGFATDQYDNLGYVSLYGAEFSSQYELAQDLEVFLNIARTWTNESEKIDVPGWVFNYGITHTFRSCPQYIDRITTTLDFRTVGPSYENTVSAGREQFPNQADFTTVNLGMNVYLTETDIGHVSIVSGVKNLFDKRYREPFFDLLQPGLSGYVALQVDF